jgi:hypothetical protein
MRVCGTSMAPGAVAELARACEMGLADAAIGDDELFQRIRGERPDEFAGLCARAANNGHKRGRALVWRRILLALIFGALVISFTGGLLLLLDTDVDRTPAQVCKDVYTTNCSLWAVAGECPQNPDYMTANCAKSCKICSGASSYLRGVDQAMGKQF